MSPQRLGAHGECNEQSFLQLCITFSRELDKMYLTLSTTANHGGVRASVVNHPLRASR